MAAAAIGAAHRAGGGDDPTGAASVRTVVAGIARQHAARPDATPRQAAPLSLDRERRPAHDARAATLRTRRGVECTESMRGLEDGAIVALVLRGLRRSEIAALRGVDVAATERPGQLRVRRARPETNPEPVLVEPSRREKCTLSDPGRLGRQTPCPRFCGGRESYGPGRGRSGYFNRFGG